ncbi:MAG: hypothetical protein O8C61_00865 [Candidatus Methanoperedens sp.]|nr:hypothetical protein [Candidatus Methanoperedens sp.]
MKLNLVLVLLVLLMVFIISGCTQSPRESTVSSPQVIYMNVNADGWTPDTFVLQKGVMVRWVINVTQLTNCNKEILVRDYNLDIKLNRGENIVEFMPNSTGAIKWSCWMDMIPGTFIVVNDPANQEEVANVTASILPDI